MPNRILREGILTGAPKYVRRGAWVNIQVKRRIVALPCAICGRPDDIECDHIVGLREGGKSEEANLQPLCRTCNSLKRHHKTNEAVRRWIASNPTKFERSQSYRTKRLALIAAGEWW
jgi:5-methylcytosine-specific restriction endonuclease McrA